ncbi:MAG: TonB family protein [Terriglobales bacterium]
MFSTLESSWDQSARRGWSAVASFGFQVMALSLLLAIPLIWVQGPPRLQWLQPLTAPLAQTPPAPPLQHRQTASSSNMVGTQLQTPPSIPPRVAQIQDTGPITPPDLPPGVWGSTGPNSPAGVLNSIGNTLPIAVLKPPAPTRPLKMSHWAEGNLIYRVQPVYPPLARQVRVQGPVLLRAIISKTGAIENLTAISGHPMLVKAAIDAVRQWRYRPYLLNDEPVEIETEITVNFVLSGS